MSGASGLPIGAVVPDVVDALRTGRRLVLEAPTGSGKSTQVPQVLVDHGLAGAGEVVVLQPRRVAARLLARRVAAERGSAVGGEVGYRVRFENRAGPATRIVYETDGILLRRLLDAPELPGVGAILFDEFHERHLQGDLLLPLALRLQETARPDLRLVVMSATLDTERLSAALDPCATVRAGGRLFPVDVDYLAHEPARGRDAVWDLAAAAAARALDEPAGGDVLVFMPGAYEIRRTLEALRPLCRGRDVRLLPLYGDLPVEQQEEALAPGGGRRVVVATNVAETSLTIEGVTTVVDSGLARKARFDPRRGIDTLLVEKICRASAEQRAGRAGRVRPGRCLRLWTAADHQARPERDVPEVQRVDPAEYLLVLRRFGFGGGTPFPWLEPPLAAAVEQAEALLADLGAVSGAGGALTPLGGRLLAFPLHPRQAAMLVAGAEAGCLGLMALAAALAEERSILVRTPGPEAAARRERLLEGQERSDLLRLVRAWEYAREHDFAVAPCEAVGIQAAGARRVAHLQRQLLAIAAGVGLRPADRECAPPEAVCRCLLAGFPDRVAARLGQGGMRYALVHGRRGTLEAHSAARSHDLLVAMDVAEVGRGRGEVEVRLSLATGVEEDWLTERFPAEVTQARRVEFDRTAGRVWAVRETRFRDLVIRRSGRLEPEGDEAAGVLAQEVLAGRVTLKQWDHAVEQWIARVNLVAAADPAWGVPPIDAEARRLLVEQVCLGAVSARDVRGRDVRRVAQGWLSEAQRRFVDRMAPERLTLPNGRTPRLVYEEGRPPRIAMRLQELYGVEAPLTIADGRVRVLVHVLAPNQRPVQITDDLGSFWRHGYEQVRKELRGRYPRHEWR